MKFSLSSWALIILFIQCILTNTELANYMQSLNQYNQAVAAIQNWNKPQIQANSLSSSNIGLRNNQNQQQIPSPPRTQQFNDVFGMNNTINGVNNTIIGHQNSIDGNWNYINGNKNTIVGSRIALIGNNKSVHRSRKL